MKGVPKAPAGAIKFNVTFDIDSNGILKVEAVEQSIGLVGNITITNEKGRLTKEQIGLMQL